MDRQLKVDIAGQSFLALAERALFWPSEKTLLVADIHLGKAATFRAAGIAVPEAIEQDLNRLTVLIESHAVERLIVLGDLFHAPEGQTVTIHDALKIWRESHRSVKMDLVRGNHDRRCDTLLAEVGIDVADQLELNGITLAHDPEDLKESGGYALTGHLHPAIRVRDGRRSFRLPCFWLSANYAVLPAFGAFTGTHVVERQKGDRAIAVANDKVALL